MAEFLPRPVWVGLWTAAGLYALVCLLATAFQARFVFYPGPPPRNTPADLGLEHREVELESADGLTLHAWYLPGDEAAGAVLVCHGNAGSMEQRLPLARAFHAMGLAVLLFDYRGYGASEGRPSEKGLYRDADAAYDFLAAEGFGPDRIVLYGESLGAAVAIELATRRPAAALVAESGFTSMPDMAARLFRWLPARWLTRFSFDNERRIAALSLPKLVVHSPQDGLIPFTCAERLVAAAAEPVELLQTDGGHNDGGFLRREDWIDRVTGFVHGALP